MISDTSSREFFEKKYEQDPDPWKFASSDYEQSRFDITIRALTNRVYQRAFEPGCSIGMLTRRLAAVCYRVEAMDISPTAAREAQQRCKSFRNVHILCGHFPAVIPSGQFDLVVFSEIGYYFNEVRLERAARKIVGRLEKGGDLLAVHWLGASEDHRLSGDKVHEILAGVRGLNHYYSERHPAFRLDRWERV
jgi:SAM-dependent methyltransferase